MPEKRLVRLKRMHAEWSAQHHELLRVNPVKAAILADALTDLQTVMRQIETTERHRSPE